MRKKGSTGEFARSLRGKSITFLYRYLILFTYWATTPEKMSKNDFESINRRLNQEWAKGLFFAGRVDPARNSGFQAGSGLENRDSWVPGRVRDRPLGSWIPGKPGVF